MTTNVTEAPPDRHQKMIDKVAKLLRQAEDAELAGRAAEAEAFQGKAFQIMAAYGISQAMARARQDGLNIKSETKAASAYFHLQGTYQRMQRVLFDELCRAMQCEAVGITKQGRTTQSLRVYGMPITSSVYKICGACSRRRPSAVWATPTPAASRPPVRWLCTGETG